MNNTTYFTILFCTIFLSSCESSKNTSKQNGFDIRKQILGKSFLDSEVLSIDIVQVEHPMLGGIIDSKKLNQTEQKKFLEDFENLKEKGFYKCMSNYVIRLNFERDTLRLKVCGKLISNRESDLYYGLASGESIIEEYFDEK